MYQVVVVVFGLMFASTRSRSWARVIFESAVRFLYELVRFQGPRAHPKLAFGREKTPDEMADAYACLLVGLEKTLMDHGKDSPASATAVIPSPSNSSDLSPRWRVHVSRIHVSTDHTCKGVTYHPSDPVRPGTYLLPIYSIVMRA